VNTEPSHKQLETLLKYYQDGRYVEAEKLALLITKKFPKHQFAWKVLTVIFNRTNKIPEALYAIKKSVQLNPNDIESYKNLSFILQKLGKLNEAEESYKKILILKPDSIEVYNYLGVLQHEQGKFIEAEASYRKMIALKPGFAEVYNNLGNTLNEQGKFIEAEASFRKAIILKPEYFEVYYNMGIMLNVQHKFNEAEESYKKALAIKPDYVEAYNNLGNTLNEQGKFIEAEVSFRKAIALKPDHVVAYNNLGITLDEQGKFIEAEASFRKAIALKPDYTEAYSNLGKILHELGKLEEAIENYDKAIKSKVDYFKAYNNKNFCLNYSSSYSPLYIYTQHLKFEKQFGGFKAKSPLSVKIKKKSNERLRIGYVSGDFRAHSVAYFFKPLLQNHNSHVVETFCYYNNNFIDKITNNIMTTCDHWRSIFGITDSEIFKIIRKDKIDILVDLSGHTGKNNLLVFAQKPAPIQVTWLGYPNTTGLSSIDYRFTDIIADPIGEADDLHSEKLLRLPNGFLCFQGNEKVLSKSDPPQTHYDYITFGSFNNLSKITSEVIDVWSKILNLIPKSHLILKCRKLKHNKDYYYELFKNKGIDKDRIQLYEHLPSTGDHLELYNSIDISLDPFPYNGATTTCEALWMGVPVITLLGDRHAGRVGASILTNVGLKDFIARDIDSYINLAVKMSANTKKLKEIRMTLRRQMQESLLCDARSFAGNVETSYKDMWHNYQK
jgi:protein O-GlcNAc transferase